LISPRRSRVVQWRKLDPSVGQGNRIWISGPIALFCKKDS